MLLGVPQKILREGSDEHVTALDDAYGYAVFP
jgi:hypothetical protein